MPPAGGDHTGPSQTAVGGHFEDLSCRKKKTHQKSKSHYHVHVIVVVYVLLLLDHADAKFSMFVKN